MTPIRVSAFIDGFNLYHAIDDLGANHLKWLDLRKLSLQFAPGPQLTLENVFYFTAHATWRPDAYARHRQYVRALETVGVTPVLGQFKAKFRTCRKCGVKVTTHEEKETDVNLALYLLREGYRGSYDRALIISGDSDIAPAVRMVREECPEIDHRILTPVGRDHSWDLVRAAGGKSCAKKLKLIHLERSLLPSKLVDDSGQAVATRPRKYDPA